MNRIPVPYSFEMAELIREDVLLFTTDGSQPNVMTLTFKSIGIILGDPCLSIFVNSKRYSSELLEKHGEFTICRGGNVHSYISGCGKYTGRDTNKIELLSMKMQDSAFLSVPVLSDAHVSYECKLVEYSKNVILEGYHMYIGHIEGVFLHA